MDLEKMKQKKQLVLEYLLNSPADVRCLAVGNFQDEGPADQPGRGIYYKGIMFTPVGTVKWDTGGSRWVTKALARRLEKIWNRGEHPCVDLSMNDLCANWKSYGLWDDRDFEKALLEKYEHNASTTPSV